MESDSKSYKRGDCCLGERTGSRSCKHLAAAGDQRGCRALLSLAVTHVHSEIRVLDFRY